MCGLASTRSNPAIIESRAAEVSKHNPGVFVCKISTISCEITKQRQDPASLILHRKVMEKNTLILGGGFCAHALKLPLHLFYSFSFSPSQSNPYHFFLILSSPVSVCMLRELCVTLCPKIYRKSVLHLMYRFSVNCWTLSSI